MTAATRQKEYRVRQALGVRVTPVELPDVVTETLIEKGYLTEAESVDAKRRADALLKFVRDNLVLCVTPKHNL